MLAHSFSFDATVCGIRPLEGVRVLAGSPAGVSGGARAEGAPAGGVAEAGCGGAAGAATGVGGAGACGGGVGVSAGGVPASPHVAPLAPSQLDLACAGLAQECRLTARESEVLELLARGRNAAYIQDELTLTRNTVKSYVSDVYHKLGVHSHQELIDLVEGRQ